MNYAAELLAVLFTLWFICVMYITYLFGKLIYRYRYYELVIYKPHRYIVTYIFAFPLFIIALVLMKTFREWS